MEKYFLLIPLLYKPYAKSKKCWIVWTKTRKKQASLGIFSSISLLLCARFANQLSNLPPAAQSRSRMCRCILRDVLTFINCNSCTVPCYRTITYRMCLKVVELYSICRKLCCANLFSCFVGKASQELLKFCQKYAGHKHSRGTLDFLFGHL